MNIAGPSHLIIFRYSKPRCLAVNQNHSVYFRRKRTKLFACLLTRHWTGLWEAILVALQWHKAFERTPLRQSADHSLSALGSECQLHLLHTIHNCDLDFITINKYVVAEVQYALSFDSKRDTITHYLWCSQVLIKQIWKCSFSLTHLCPESFLRRFSWHSLR